jgi:hypothetical protein
MVLERSVRTRSSSPHTHPPSFSFWRRSDWHLEARKPADNEMVLERSVRTRSSSPHTHPLSFSFWRRTGSSEICGSFALLAGSKLQLVNTTSTGRRWRYWCPCVETACLVVLRLRGRKPHGSAINNLHTQLTSARSNSDNSLCCCLRSLVPGITKLIKRPKISARAAFCCENVRYVYGIIVYISYI